MSGSTKPVRRLLGDYPMEDATDATTLFVQPIDIKNGVPENPDKCAIAQCAMRAIGTDLAVIYRTQAWIKVPDGDGFKVLRYSILGAEQKKIKQFDETGVMPPGGVRLAPPSPGKTLAHYAVKNAARRDRTHDKNGQKYAATGNNSPVNTRGHRARLVTRPA